MSGIALDASVALAWSFRDEATAATWAVLATEDSQMWAAATSLGIALLGA